ncbi:MAG: ABC transporter ATP-binding protein [Phycisphaerae bacterium]
MPQPPSIQVHGVGKRFRRGVAHDSLRDLLPALTRRLLARPRPTGCDDFWALRGVDLTVEPGQALGIIGPNGAGKSTMLKILSRILRPDEGRVSVTGRLSSLIEIGAGFHPDLTGRENIFLNGAILGMTRREIDAKFEAIVDFAELSDFIETPIKRYSSGMHARLGFSVAAHMEPQFLLVDEVLSVGDYHFRTKCHQRMRQFLADGVGVVFVSHNTDAVGALCDRCLVLHHGQVEYYGDAAHAIHRYYALQRAAPSDQDSESDRAVRVENVSLEHPDGSPGASFRNGDRAVLRVEIASDIDAKVSIGLVIQTDNNVLVADTATTRLLDQPVHLQAGQRYEVAFEFSIRFCPGAYRLSINVEDPLLRRYHAFARNIAGLAVTDGHATSGICNIEPLVHITSASTASPAPRNLAEVAP